MCIGLLLDSLVCHNAGLSEHGNEVALVQSSLVQAPPLAGSCDLHYYPSTPHLE